MELCVTKRTDDRLLDRMKRHYSQPKGFVGRNICYSIVHDGQYFGHIVAGSATRFLPNRNEFLHITLSKLNKVINNIFFNVSPSLGKYPYRNFVSDVIKNFVRVAKVDWFNKYGDSAIGFETLVEKPRKGTCYIRAGWKVIGETKGYTCKRVAGKGSDSWSGRRVWCTDRKKLRPKLVLCYKLTS